MKKDIILGVDPGLANTGYGIVEHQGSKFRLIDYGTIVTKSTLKLSHRLGIIYKELSLIIHQHQPKFLSVEDLFFCKNVKSALAVGQAKGVILLAGEMNDLLVSEYTPLQIKQSIVGYGKGTKDQVSQMVKLVLNLREIPKPDHAADALAAAICCANDSFKHKELL